MAISKVIYGGNTLIDLTSDTLEPDKLLKGYTAHGADGEPVTGTCEYDVNSSNGTATAAEILSGKTAAVKGTIIKGTMKNNGAVKGTISTVSGAYTVPQGYHDGSGKVTIDATEQAKIIATNIREGVTILGVKGSMSGTEDAKAQNVEVTPKTIEQTVLPDSTKGFNYIAQVKINAIPYAESANSSGGTTVTIG